MTTGSHYVLQDNIKSITEEDLFNKPSTSGTSLYIPDACTSSTQIEELSKMTSKAVIADRTCAIEIAREQSSSSKKLCSCNMNHGYIPSPELDNKISFVYINRVQKKLPSNKVETGMNSGTTLQNTNAEHPHFNRPSQQETGELVKPWEDVRGFKAEWIASMQKYHSRYIPFNVLTKEVKVWLEYLFNNRNPKSSTYRCRFCSAFQQLKNLKNAPSLSTREGYFTPNYLRMWKTLTQHAQSIFHKKAIAHAQEQFIVFSNINKETIGKLRSRNAGLRGNFKID
jgi:hypothetical protein